MDCLKRQVFITAFCSCCPGLVVKGLITFPRLFSITDTASEGVLSVPGQHFKQNGAERVRTSDILRARQALFQLSYNPWWHVVLSHTCRGLFLDGQVTY